MIGSINRELAISYSDKDLTKKGKHHNDLLHIIVDAMGKRIPMVLVDDGSALNYFLRMNLGRAVKKPTVQDLAIPTATPPFRLG